MATTDRERILAFLRSVSPRGATDSEIREPTGRAVRRRAPALRVRYLQRR